jgi:hypothetical protein
MSTQHVAFSRLQCVAMTDPIRIAQGSRLRTMRLAAKYPSARAAALDAGWPESTYRSHEAGTRTIDPRDALRYSTWFKHKGAKNPKFNGKWIVYGDEDELKPADFEELLQNESAAFRRAAYQAILDLKKPTK